MEFCEHLYNVSPAYRKLVNDYRRLQQEYGALQAAYGNALNDRDRAKGELKRVEQVFRALVDTIVSNVADIEIAHRDDPGRYGSGR